MVCLVSCHWKLALLAACIVTSFPHVYGDDHYEEPVVDLVSCLAGVLRLTLSNSQEGGIMYIRQNSLAYNIQPTVNGSMNYTCSFDVCRIEWNQLFIVVLQRMPLIETRHDIHSIFICIANMGDLTPGKGTVSDGEQNNMAYFLFRAEAAMRFYKNGSDLDSGSYVKLGEPVKMIIELTNDDEGLLDINVRSCEASGIPLIDDRCPADVDLFDVYNKTGTGVVENDFLMFRTTTLNSDPVNMIFSCVLEVCHAPCTEYTCNGTEATPVGSRRKRQAEQLKTMSVSAVFKVGTTDPVPMKVPKPRDCIESSMYTAVFATLSFMLVFTVSMATYYTREWFVKRDVKAEPSTQTPEASPKGVGVVIETKQNNHDNTSAKVTGDKMANTEKKQNVSTTSGTVTGGKSESQAVRQGQIGVKAINKGQEKSSLPGDTVNAGINGDAGIKRSNHGNKATRQNTQRQDYKDPQGNLVKPGINSVKKGLTLAPLCTTMIQNRAPVGHTKSLPNSPAVGNTNVPVFSMFDNRAHFGCTNSLPNSPASLNTNVSTISAFDNRAQVGYTHSLPNSPTVGNTISSVKLTLPKSPLVDNNSVQAVRNSQQGYFSYNNTTIGRPVDMNTGQVNVPSSPAGIGTSLQVDGTNVRIGDINTLHVTKKTMIPKPILKKPKVAQTIANESAERTKQDDKEAKQDEAAILQKIQTCFRLNPRRSSLQKTDSLKNLISDE